MKYSEVRRQMQHMNDHATEDLFPMIREECKLDETIAEACSEHGLTLHEALDTIVYEANRP